MTHIHDISLKCVRIQILAEDTQAHLTWASGFFCKWKMKTFLVTNWHAVTLKNFETKKNMHSSGVSPGFFSLHFHTISKNQNGSTSWHEKFIPLLELYNFEMENDEKKYTTPKWHEHPLHGSDFDVVAIEIAVPKEMQTPPYELACFDLENEMKKEKTLGIMDNVFITGYPLDTTTTPNKFPIYKGGTIASEPDIFGKLPIFYVDGKTKPGMSGSPVVKKDERIKINQSASEIQFNQGRVEFVGIYSGRDKNEKEYTAELGIVWRFQESLIPILDSATNANNVN